MSRSYASSAGWTTSELSLEVKEDAQEGAYDIKLAK